jgi:hypothetical protein
MSSLRPQTNKSHDLGRLEYRWNTLFVDGVNSTGQSYLEDTNISGDLLLGPNNVNVLDKLVELEENSGTGNGTVTSINALLPDNSGNVLINASHISSSLVVYNFTTSSDQLGINRYIKGIDNKFLNVSYINANEEITGEKEFSTAAYGSYSIPSNNDTTLLATTQWVNDKFGSLSGALTYKGAVSYDSNLLKNASIGDVYAISNTGILEGTTYVFPGNLVIFKEDLTGTITPTSYNIIDINVGIRSINGLSNPNSTLSTGHIQEGTGINPVTDLPNLWFTNARARSAISSTAQHISYDNSTGVISSTLTPFAKTDVRDMFVGNQHSGISFTYANNVITASVTSQGSVTSVNSISPTNGNITLVTSNISEDNNLYFTTSRARSAFSAGTGISITEGQISTSITQYTDNLAKTAVVINDMSGTQTTQSPSVQSVKDYISTNSSLWTESSIKNLFSASGDYLSYDNSTGIITSSLTNNAIQTQAKSAISSNSSYVSYNNGIINDTISTNFLTGSLKGSANGVASLDANGKIPSGQLPALQITNVTSGLDANKPSPATEGDFFIATDANKSYVYDGSSWVQITSGINISNVNGQSGPTVNLTTDNISQGSTNKYFSNAQAREAISTTGNYLTYNSTTGVITSSLTDTSINNLADARVVALLSGSSQSTQHSGIQFVYANGVLSASVSSQGSVTSVNSVSPSNGNVTLQSDKIATNSLTNSYYNTGSVSSAVSDSLYGHINGILQNAVFKDKLTTDLTSSSATFKDINVHNGTLTVSGSTNNPAMVNMVDTLYVNVPTLASSDWLIASNAAVNKNWLNQYATNQLVVKSNNLSDVPDKSAARTNLGLGTVATKNTGTANDNIPLLSSTGLPAVSGENLTKLPSLSTISNVSVTSLTAGDVLQYTTENSVSAWRNKKISNPKPKFLRNPIALTASDFTTNDTTTLIVLTSATNISVPASTSANDGCIYHIKKTTTSNITIAGTFLEFSSFVLTGDYSSLTIISDWNGADANGRWMVI